jgi:hypothetical protein
MALFTCAQIPAMGAPAASLDLQHKTHEKAADTHTTASSIWYIFNYFALSPRQILPRSVVRVVAIPPHSYKNSCGRSHSRVSLTGKEDHGETRIFKIY